MILNVRLLSIVFYFVIWGVAILYLKGWIENFFLQLLTISFITCHLIILAIVFTTYWII